MSEAIPPVYQEIIDRHGSIRQSVESRYPGYHVTHIKGCAETRYGATLHSQRELAPLQDYILTIAELVFEVEAVYLGSRIAMNVYVQNTGELSFGVTVILPFDEAAHR